MKEKLEELLVELRDAYEKSDNKNNAFCIKNNRKWGYELIQTALIEGQPIIIGFNWGVDNTWEEYLKGNQYEHQISIQEQTFENIYMGSLKRAMNLCKEVFPDINFTNGSHSNFCFFRSEKEDQISEEDIKLSIPIFRKLIEIIKPSVMFCFSSRARDYMINSGMILNKEEKIISLKTHGKRRNTFKAVKGLFANNTKVYCLPHPNSKIKKEIRLEAWSFCKDVK